MLDNNLVIPDIFLDVRALLFLYIYVFWKHCENSIKIMLGKKNKKHKHMVRATHPVMV